MGAIKSFFSNVFDYIIGAYDWLLDKFISLNDMVDDLILEVPFVGEKIVGVSYLTTIILGVLMLLAVILVLVIIKKIFFRGKPKCYFHIGKKKIVKKHKKAESILYPDPEDLEMEGKVFAGWYLDKKFNVEFEGENTRNRKLHLFAKFEDASEEQEYIIEQVEDDEELISNESEVVVENSAYETSEETEIVKDVTENVSEETPIKEEKLVKISPVGVSTSLVYEELNVPVLQGIGEVYDTLKNEIMSYDRCPAFNDIGVASKKIIAEMFERANKIYLYLAIDPKTLQERGYDVEKYDEQLFAVVPTKIVLEDARKLSLAISAIKEAMLFNNMVKNEYYQTNVKSDATQRRNGFAFFVKNDVIVKTSAEIYKLIRSEINTFKAKEVKVFNRDESGKMIIKVFKNKELVTMYLAVDDESDKLEFVGYDKNFADTPYKFEIKSVEDYFRAQTLIYKLMYLYDMEKHLDNVEVSFNDEVPETCGFGYRVRY